MTTKIEDIRENSIFSENSRFKAVGTRDEKTIHFVHIESGKNIGLTPEYVEKFLKSADQYDQTIVVGLEDKIWNAKQIEKGLAENTWTEGNVPLVGSLKLPGIRTIFEKIATDQVFTATYQKADTVLTDAEYTRLLSEQKADSVSRIRATQRSKKNVANIAEEEFIRLQENPILKVIPGEIRTIRAYKTTFTSRDGLYFCVDLDIPAGTSGRDNLRQINIRTLKSIIFDGTKYEIE